MKKTVILVLAILICLQIQAQKRIDNMSFDQLNAFKHNAIKLKNAGMSATFFGLGFLVIGGTTTLILATGHRGEETFGLEVVPLIVGAGICAPCALVGVPLWVTGAARKKKAEIAIQKFNYAPDRSQTLGLRLTIRF